MEAKQPISFRCENKAELKAAYQWLLKNGYLDQRWVELEKEGSLFPRKYPYTIGVSKTGSVMMGTSFNDCLNTQPASSLLATEIFKAIKRNDHEIHVYKRS